MPGMKLKALSIFRKKEKKTEERKKHVT